MRPFNISSVVTRSMDKPIRSWLVIPFISKPVYTLGEKEIPESNAHGYLWAMNHAYTVRACQDRASGNRTGFNRGITLFIEEYTKAYEI